MILVKNRRLILSISQPDTLLFVSLSIPSVAAKHPATEVVIIDERSISQKDEGALAGELNLAFHYLSAQWKLYFLIETFGSQILRVLAVEYADLQLIRPSNFCETVGILCIVNAGGNSPNVLPK